MTTTASEKPAPQKARQIHLPDELLAAIDRWRAAQRDVPNRSEAIRRLMRLGLGLGEVAK